MEKCFDKGCIENKVTFNLSRVQRPSGGGCRKRKRAFAQASLANALYPFSGIALRCLDWLAERQGFEPWKRFGHLHTFQACAFDHSAISPRWRTLLSSKRKEDCKGSAKVQFFSIQITTTSYILIYQVHVGLALLFIIHYLCSIVAFLNGGPCGKKK